MCESETEFSGRVGAASLCAVCEGCVAKRQALFPRVPGSLRTSRPFAIQYAAPIPWASDGLRSRTLADGLRPPIGESAAPPTSNPTANPKTN